MRKLIGRRDPSFPTQIPQRAPDPGLLTRAVDVPSYCLECGVDVRVVLIETIATGEIWVESPDSCQNCGIAISDPDEELTLTQEQICEYFKE